MKVANNDVRLRRFQVPLHRPPSSMFQFKVGVKIIIPDWAIQRLKFDNHGPWPEAPLVMWAHRISEASLDLIICASDSEVKSHRVWLPNDVRADQLMELDKIAGTDARAKHAESV